MNVESQPHTKSNIKNKIVLFILFTLIILALTGGTSTYLYKNEINSFYSTLINREIDSITRQRGLVYGFLDNTLRKKVITGPL